MKLQRSLGIGTLRTNLVVVAVATLGLNCSVRGEQPSADTVKKLIAQLGDNNFRTRERASADMVRIGLPMLPVLRKALDANPELEIKRRIDLVIAQIERSVLEAEEKQWQDFDAPKLGIKDRVNKLLTKSKPLSDDQLGSAICLLTAGRSATAGEIEKAKKQFGDADGRSARVLAFAREQVASKEFNADVAAANVSLLALEKELAKSPGGVSSLNANATLVAKAAGEIAASLQKGLKDDEHIVDVACVLVLSRFPTGPEAARIVEFLKKGGDRAMALTDIVWALMNSKEFLTNK